MHATSAWTIHPWSWMPYDADPSESQNSLDPLFWLELPEHWRVSNTFHRSELHIATEDHIMEWVNWEAPHVQVMGHEQEVIDKVINTQWRWAGISSRSSTWLWPWAQQVGTINSLWISSSSIVGQMPIHKKGLVRVYIPGANGPSLRMKCGGVCLVRGKWQINFMHQSPMHPLCMCESQLLGMAMRSCGCNHLWSQLSGLGC